MKQHIHNFPTYLHDGYILGQSVSLSALPRSYTSVLLVGMGGSGMVAQLIKTLITYHTPSLFCDICHDYTIPTWVTSSTIVIIASYTGSTEEALEAYDACHAKGALIIAVTSGGPLFQKATEAGTMVIQMPTGLSPRAAMPYSLGIHLAIADQYQRIGGSPLHDITTFQDYCLTATASVQTAIYQEAQKIVQTIPAIYTTQPFESVAIRLRQQLNENARILCRHHTLPEMNHNELLGRELGNPHVSAIFFEELHPHPRNAKRISLTKKILAERNIPTVSLTLAGNSLLEQSLTGIYQSDRLSIALAELQGIDPDQVALITWFKQQLNDASV